MKPPKSRISRMALMGSCLLLPLAGLSPAVSAEPQFIGLETYSQFTINGGDFGTAIATSGDWMAVGIPRAVRTYYHRTSAAVLICQRQDGRWRVRQTLEDEGFVIGNPNYQNTFGSHLVMGPGVLLVGSQSNGVARCYRLEGDKWVFSARPEGTPTGVGPRSVAIEGNLAATAGPNHTLPGRYQAGMVQLSLRDGGNWTHEASITHPDPQVFHLGTALALNGDTLYAGAPDTGSLTGPGRVAVFKKTGGVWAWSHDIQSPVGAPNVDFGARLQVSGGHLFVADTSPSLSVYVYDLDNDLAPPAQIPFTSGTDFQASGDRVVVSGSGDSVTLFQRQPDQSWSQETTVPWGTHGLTILRSAALAGNELLLGGDTPTPVSGPVGTVNVLRRSPAGEWKLAGAPGLIPYQDFRPANFGESMSAPDSWLAVGAPNESPNEEFPGPGWAVMHRRLTNGQYVHHTVLAAPVVPGVEMGRFGVKISTSGSAVAVGNGKDVVVTYAHDEASDTWQQTQVIQSSLIGEQDFGAALKLQGDLLAIGRPESRKVTVYHQAAGQWTLEADLELPLGSTDTGLFGSSLALEGSRLLVGSPSATSKNAYMFQRSATGTWTLEDRLTPKSSAPADYGLGVAITGDHAVVGSATQVIFFERDGNEWKAEKAQPGPVIAEGDRLHVNASGKTAVVTAGTSGVVFTLTSKGWKALPDLSQIVAYEGAYFVSQELSQPYFFHCESRRLHIREVATPPAFTFEGEAAIISQEAHSVVLDAGDYLRGNKEQKLVTLTVPHAGVEPLVLTITATGDLQGFTLPKQQLVLEPGDVETLNLRFTPGQTLGERRITLTFTPNVPGVPVTTYEIRSRVVEQATALQFIQVPQAGLYDAATYPGMQVRLTGTRPWSFRWIRNGSTMSGETKATLLPTEGGTYRVEVTNSQGKILMDPVALGLYSLPKTDVITVPGLSTKVAVKASGPGVQVQWLVGGQPVQDGPDYSGSQTPVLTVKNPFQSEYCEADITMAGPGIGWSARPALTLHVLSPTIYSAFDQGTTLPLGTPLNHEYGFWMEGLDPGGPAVFQYSGLPPGVKGTPEGTLYGTPTSAGVFTTQVTAKWSGFSTVKSYRIAVTKTAMVPGIYWGWVPVSADLPEGGAVVLDVQASGTFSATLQVGTVRTPLAGSLLETSGAQSAPRPFPVQIQGETQYCWIQSADSESRVSLYLSPVASPGGPGQVLSDVVLIKPHANSPVFDRLGSHNFGLLTVDSSDSKPRGHGFGNFKVDSTRRVTYTAQLADGTTLTGATWLGDPSYDLQAGYRESLYLYQADPKTRSLLRGAPALQAGEGDPYGVVTWQRPAGPGRTYKDGFGPLQLSLAVSRYTRPQNTQILPGAEHLLSLSAEGTPLDPTAFTLTEQNRAIFGTEDVNAHQARLNINSGSGSFTGQFTLRDEDPSNPERTLTRNVQYRGLFLPEQQMGVGFFLLPTLPDPNATPPTTLSTSPIVSGSVVIEATP